MKPKDFKAAIAGLYSGETLTFKHTELENLAVFDNGMFIKNARFSAHNFLFFPDGQRAGMVYL